MSIKEDGFKLMDQAFGKMSDAEKKSQIKKVNGIFQLDVKSAAGKQVTWVIDLKENGTVTKGPAKKADVTVSMSDDTFVGLADGKVNAQKAFMTGQIKVKGNVMLATKLDSVLKTAKSKL